MSHATVKAQIHHGRKLVRLAGRTEPIRVGEVQLGASLLGEPEIRRVPDEDVPEPKAVVAGEKAARTPRFVKKGQGAPRLDEAALVPLALRL